MTQNSPDTGVFLTVHSIGPAAARLLGGGDLRVIAVFERSVYAASPDGGILCLLRGDMEEGPLHVLCGGWPARAGQMAAVGDELVNCSGTFRGRAVVLDVSRARPWVPPPWPAVLPDAARAGLARLAGAVRRCAPRGTLLYRRLCPKDCAGDAASPENILYAEISAGLDAFDRWFMTRGEASRREVFRCLAGLGPGLTPSGDDILSGLALALRACGAGDCTDAFTAGLSALASGTNALSRAHMMAAAEGMAAAPFHEVLARVLSGDDAECVLERIGRIGHSSGWDCLLGIMHALETVFTLP